MSMPPEPTTQPPEAQPESVEDERWLWRCPIHGILEPTRFDSDWPADAGYPVQLAERGVTSPCPVLGSDEDECCEQMEPVEVVPATERDQMRDERSQALSERDAERALRYVHERRADQLRTALEGAIAIVTRGRISTIGPTRAFTPQVDARTVERWRSALTSSPSSTTEEA